MISADMNPLFMSSINLGNLFILPQSVWCALKGQNEKRLVSMASPPLTFTFHHLIGLAFNSLNQRLVVLPFESLIVYLFGNLEFDLDTLRFIINNNFQFSGELSKGKIVLMWRLLY